MDVKLTVRFPADHPVLKYPPGQRSQRVRELVDMALRLESILSVIDSRLARIEDMMTSGFSGREVKNQPELLKQKNEENSVIFDVKAFADL